jgi:hypothetical protein
MRSRRSRMRIFLLLVASAALSTPMLAQEGTQRQKSENPLMVSFADLKWVELPERKGMQFAVLSGDPKIGPYTRYVRFQRELITRFTRTAARSRT